MKPEDIARLITEDVTTNNGLIFEFDLKNEIEKYLVYAPKRFTYIKWVLDHNIKGEDGVMGYGLRPGFAQGPEYLNLEQAEKLIQACAKYKHVIGEVEIIKSTPKSSARPTAEPDSEGYW